MKRRIVRIRWIGFIGLSAIMCGCGADAGPRPQSSSGSAAPPAVRVSGSGGKSLQIALADATEDQPAEEGWGDLVARFVYDGEPPVRKKVAITKDIEVCAKHPMMDESLVVNQENRGVANVIIWVRDKVSRVHESYAENANDEVFVDNQQCRFEPHICLLRTTQTLVLGNKDSVGHNTKADLLRNASFNYLVPARGNRKITTLKEAERLPVPIGCNIHPWMSGKLLVKDHPYMAVSDENGEVEIKNLPAGEWTFQVWHEQSGYVRNKAGEDKITIGGAPVEWKKGRFKHTVSSGVVDLGDVMLKPATFE